MADDLHRVPGLIDENPIVIYPSIAKYLGINKAAIIQQLHFLLNVTKANRTAYNFVEDKWWVYNSYREWQENYFTWLSESAIKRLFIELEKDGFVKSMQSVKSKSDRKKWYSIDYPVWTQFVLSMGQKRDDQPSSHFETMVVPKLSDGYTETTTDIKEKETAPAIAEVSAPLTLVKTEPQPKEKKARPKHQNEDLHHAIVRQCGLDPDSITPAADKLFWTATAELKKINFDIADVPGLHAYVEELARKGKWTDWGAMSLSKYAPKYLAQRKKSAQPSPHAAVEVVEMDINSFRRKPAPKPEDIAS